jgi:hypothetical protein
MKRYKAFYIDNEKKLIGIAKNSCRTCYSRGIVGMSIENYQRLKQANVSDDYLTRDALLCKCVKIIKFDDVDKFSIDLSEVDFSLDKGE